MWELVRSFRTNCVNTNYITDGLVIPHFGTIVVGSGNQIGNYAVLHTCICITAGNKQIGNGLYCSTGARILGDVSVGDSVTVGANAVLNHSVGSNSLVVGIPALKKRDEEAWYKGEYLRRVEECEKLRLSYSMKYISLFPYNAGTLILR